jgi:hypothetical protein
MARYPNLLSQRRRYNKPASYRTAEPVTIGTAAPQPKLGFTAHKLIEDLWKSLARSVESQFYPAADWQRARLELFYTNALLLGERQLSAPAWSVAQAGLSELLISPADKRRAGIELARSQVDADEVHAVEQIAEYRERLKSV